MAALNISLVSCGDDEPETSPLFKEPCLQWGANKSTVKNFMKDFSLAYEEDDGLSYHGKYKEESTIYYFEDGELSVSTVALLTSKVSYNELMAFLKEKYDFIKHDNENDVDLFMTKDKKSGIGLTKTDGDSENAYFVTYIDVNSPDNLK